MISRYPDPPDRFDLTDAQIQKIFAKVDTFQVPLNEVQFDVNLFKGYKRIIIVGNQRSGTTFTSQAIAKSLSFKCFDEKEFHTKDVDKFKNILKQKNIIVQAPGLTHLIHNLVSKDDLVIFMVRKWSDIFKSIYRNSGRLTNWVFMDSVYQLNRYYYSYGYYRDSNLNTQELYDTKDEECDAIFNKVVDRSSYHLDVVYKMWKFYQRDLITNYIELDYESLKSHPLWIDKKFRKEFSPKQTKRNSLKQIIKTILEFFFLLNIVRSLLKKFKR